jgi:hypothetical protein
MRKTHRRQNLRKTYKRKRGGMLPLPNDAALRVSVPENSDNLLLSGGKRRRRK